MYAAFPGHDEALAQLSEIADRVDIDLDLGKRHFPVVPAARRARRPRRTCASCASRACASATATHPPPGGAASGSSTSCGIINQLGFASYFLIVWDFVRFARETGIPATARGSACGALVSYVLVPQPRLTRSKYDLLFERFLDPNRTEAPDIDIDFCKDRRDEVIEYVKEKYGEANVAQIGTFGTLAAQAAIKRRRPRAGHAARRGSTQVAKLVPDAAATSRSTRRSRRSPS